MGQEGLTPGCRPRELGGRGRVKAVGFSHVEWITLNTNRLHANIDL